MHKQCVILRGRCERCDRLTAEDNSIGFELREHYGNLCLQCELHELLGSVLVKWENNIEMGLKCGGRA